MGRKRSLGAEPNARGALGRGREDALFPAPPPRAGLPEDYAEVLRHIKGRIEQERLHVALAANSAMVLLYWDLGRLILERQERAGWGAGVIDRLSADLREAFPEMKGFSPRNLKYMRAFASAWSDREIVQGALAQITWYHNVALLERVPDPYTRLWYARETLRHGWSQPILCLQIEGRAHERQGKAVTNFPEALPPADSDMASQVFKDPYLFDFLGTADPRREREIEQALVDHIHDFTCVPLGSPERPAGRELASARPQDEAPGQRSPSVLVRRGPRAPSAQGSRHSDSCLRPRPPPRGPGEALGEGAG